MGSEGEKQWSPARREFGKADDLNLTEDGRRMGEAISRGSDNVDGAHHARRQFSKNSWFQARNGFETRMADCLCCEVDARAPNLVERVGRRFNHAW